MDRLLLVPAAGLGTRLGGSTPKLLVEVNGRPMIEHLLELYSALAERAVLVVHPAAEALVRARLGDRADIAVQSEPTGMLDAILLASSWVEHYRPRRVLITWCDQLAIHPNTIDRLAAATSGPNAPTLVLPTCVRPEPYIHFARDASGRIDRVLHRREGDTMPDIGESDAGVFDLSLQAYRELLPEFARAGDIGAGTGERNFLPFVAWVSARQPVVTIPCTSLEETIGVNTREELARVERYLAGRSIPDA